MPQGDGFSAKTLRKSLFHCQNDWSCKCLAGQFWLLENSSYHYSACYLLPSCGLQALRFTGKLKYYSFIIDRFEGLIDREWLRGGHPFTERCIKVGVSPVRYKGQGAVFLLFLDCVWQVSFENKNHETIPSRFFPEQETKRSFVFRHLSSHWRRGTLIKAWCPRRQFVMISAMAIFFVS